MESGAHDDYIVSMGFIQNECPSRDSLDYERDWVVPDKKLKSEKEKARRGGSDKGIAIVILAIIIGVMAIFSIYCCLKNRGQFCKGKKEPGAGGDISVQQDDNSIVERRKKVPTASNDFDNEAVNRE